MQKIKYNAPVTLTFVFLCVAALILSKITRGATDMLFFSTYRSSLLSPLTYIRLFGHVFGHSGWDHLFSNMTYILLLGPMAEEKYGGHRLVEIIALTAVVSAVINAVIFPNVALMGASGVCFALIVMCSVTSVKGGGIPLTLILVFLVFVGKEVYNAFAVADSISQTTHIIGGVIGANMGMKYARKV